MREIVLAIFAVALAIVMIETDEQAIHDTHINYEVTLIEPRVELMSLKQAVVNFLAKNYTVMFLDMEEQRNIAAAFEAGEEGPFPPGVTSTFFPTIESHRDIRVHYHRENPGLAFISLPLVHMWGHGHMISRNYIYKDGGFTFLGMGSGRHADVMGMDAAGRLVINESHIGDGWENVIRYVDSLDPDRQGHYFEFNTWGDALDFAHEHFDGLASFINDWDNFGIEELEEHIMKRARLLMLEMAVVDFLAENYAVMFLDWDITQIMMDAFADGRDGPFPSGVSTIFPTVESHSDIQVRYHRENPSSAFISLPLVNMWGFNVISRNYLYEGGAFTFLGESSGHRAGYVGMSDDSRLVMQQSFPGGNYDILMFLYVDANDPDRQRNVFMNLTSKWDGERFAPLVDEINGMEFDTWLEAYRFVEDYFGFTNFWEEWGNFGIGKIEECISEKARLASAEYVYYWRAKQ